MLDLQQINWLNKNIWYFRFKKFWEDYLITNDIAKHSFLTKEEFGDFISWKIVSWDKYDELLEKKFIKNESYENDMIMWYAKKNEFLAHWPSLHIIVVTLRCNHKCKYCHAAAAPMLSKDMDMTEETARKVVDTIFFTSNTNLTIEFQWWETLVNWDIIKFIVEYSEIKSKYLKKNITFALVTNLTLMDDEKLKYIIDHNIFICTSLDWDEETHNYNRTYKEWNSYEEVTNWIKKINNKYKELGTKQKVWALLTVTRKTLNKHKEVIDTYEKLWLDSIFLRPLNPYWFAASDLETLWYEQEEFLEFYEKSMEYILELNKKWTVFTERLSSMYLSKMLTDKDPNYLDERSPCWACIGQVAYNYDWKIYSCDEWRMLWRMWDDNFKMVDIKDWWEETYKEMIESETTKIMVQASTLDWLPWYNDSVYKPYIWVCPIHSYKLTWNIIANYSKDEKKKLDYKILDYLFNSIRISWNIELYNKWIGVRDEAFITSCEIR